MTTKYYHPQFSQYSDEMSESLYYKHMASVVGYYAPAYSNVIMLTSALGKGPTPTRELINALLDDVYPAVASVYKSDPRRGAAMLTDLVKPASETASVLLARLVVGLQTRIVLCNYASSSVDNEDDRYTMVACLFILSRFEEYRNVVAEACSGMLNTAIVEFDQPLARQQHLADMFFGRAWESLYVNDVLTPADIVRDILKLRPPFTNDECKFSIEVDIPNNLSD